jgi:hypothetical protein
MRFILFIMISACLLVFRQVAAADLPLSGKEEAAARRIYSVKCAKCHEFYNPSDYNDREWRSWMSKMKKKSHLNTEDYDLLLRYTENLRGEKK